MKVLDPESGEEVWKQVQRNTRQTDRKKAERAAEEIEAAVLAEYGSGEEKSKKMLGVLSAATEEAVKGLLTEPLARKMLTEIYAIANGSELVTYTTQEWFDEWLERKKRTVKISTFALYRGAVNAFLRWLDQRADLRLETVTTPDIRQWRDQLHDEGRTGKTVGQYQKTVS
ncbi:MAG: site-specific integrase, partial [Verrucomicrobiales bacterium]|nr:site-specific integrase [Verrucomicrobiales bacterium]